MSGEKPKKMLRGPVSRGPRLPKGTTAEALCKLEGRWPKREPSHEELLDTYKAFFSSRFRAEALMVLDAFRKEYGDSIFAIVEQVYYEMGKAEGVAEKESYGSLLNKHLDIFVRPHCYVCEHLETSEARLDYRVLKCPFYDLVHEMGLDEIGRHMCLPWHKGYAEAMGYRVSLPEFFYDGDGCCREVWEKID